MFSFLLLLVIINTLLENIGKDFNHGHCLRHTELFLLVLVYSFFERVSLKAVKAEIFIRVRNLSPAIGARVSARWKLSTLRRESHVLDARAGRYIHEICEVQCIWTRTVQLVANITLKTHDSVPESTACDLPKSSQKNQSV